MNQLELLNRLSMTIRLRDVVYIAFFRGRVSLCVCVVACALLEMSFHRERKRETKRGRLIFVRDVRAVRYTGKLFVGSFRE